MARILVCEDDPLYRELYAATLGAAGHEVTTAEDGRSGLDLLNAGDFALVLTDLVMPDMDGLELIRAVRASRPGIPVIAVSAGVTGFVDPLLRAADSFGATRVLQKPVKPVALIAAIAELLPRP